MSFFSNSFKTVSIATEFLVFKYFLSIFYFIVFNVSLASSSFIV
nr:MAG TPA: hypothetical protein [Bacteriophage sp.]